jgi:hypothetical protein
LHAGHVDRDQAVEHAFGIRAADIDDIERGYVIQAGGGTHRHHLVVRVGVVTPGNRHVVPGIPVELGTQFGMANIQDGISRHFNLSTNGRKLKKQ